MAGRSQTDSVAAFVAANQDLLDEILGDPDDPLKKPDQQPLDVAARHLLRRKVTDVLAVAGQHQPPVNLYRVARHLNVRRIMRSKLNAEGRIVRDGNAYDVEINASAPRTRQRFSLAHELAHTFFLQHVPVLTRSRAESAEQTRHWQHEEYLCHFAAAEFLMPASAFIRDAASVGPSLLAANWLSRRWDVSREACYRRIIDIAAWPVGFLLLRKNSEGYQVCGHPGIAGGAYITKCVSYSSPLGRVLGTRASWKGRLMLNLGGPAESYYCDVEAGTAGRDAVVMTILAPDAEPLCRRSQLKIWSKQPSNLANATVPHK